MKQETTAVGDREIVLFIGSSLSDMQSFSAHTTESVSLRKCPYDHRLTSKAYLSAITATNISPSFYLQDGGKNQPAQIRNRIASLSPCVWRTVYLMT